MTRQFDWYGPSVVVPEQQPIAVYQEGDDGFIRIRQREGDDGYDPIIDLAPSCALEFCRAILREAGLHSFVIVHASQMRWRPTMRRRWNGRHRRTGQPLIASDGIARRNAKLPRPSLLTA